MKFHLNRRSRERIERFDGAKERGQDRQEAEARGFSVVALTDIGMVRRTNQDSLIHAGSLAGVADGMGGHLGGETASALCRDTLVEALRGKTPEAQALKEAVAQANRAVYERSMADERVHGMGTTLCVLWVGADRVWLAHVGDSRCYRYAGGVLTQVSDDHSMVMEMVRAGILTAEQAAVHPMRNMITRAVGTDAEVEPDILDFPRTEGDLWLLCSDGLSGMVDDAGIAEILGGDCPDAEKAQQLLDAALAAGGHDNISVVLVRVDRGGASA